MPHVIVGVFIIVMHALVTTSHDYNGHAEDDCKRRHDDRWGLPDAGCNKDHVKRSCMLDPEWGECGRYGSLVKYTRYYFSMSVKACKPFSWGGCSQNENHFQTIAECTRQCGSLIGTTTKARPSNPTTMPQPRPRITTTPSELCDHCPAYLLRIRLKNSFSFYIKHRSEYVTKFKAAVCRHVSLKLSQIKIRKIVDGSTIIWISITGSYSIQKIEAFISKVENGQFIFLVANRKIMSVNKQMVQGNPTGSTIVWKVVIPILITFTLGLVAGFIAVHFCKKKAKVESPKPKYAWPANNKPSSSSTRGEADPPRPNDPPVYVPPIQRHPLPGQVDIWFKKKPGINTSSVDIINPHTFCA